MIIDGVLCPPGGELYHVYSRVVDGGSFSVYKGATENGYAVLKVKLHIDSHVHFGGTRPHSCGRQGPGLHGDRCCLLCLPAAGGQLLCPLGLPPVSASEGELAQRRQSSSDQLFPVPGRLCHRLLQPSGSHVHCESLPVQVPIQVLRSAPYHPIRRQHHSRSPSNNPEEPKS